MVVPLPTSFLHHLGASSLCPWVGSGCQPGVGEGDDLSIKTPALWASVPSAAGSLKTGLGHRDPPAGPNSAEEVMICRDRVQLRTQCAPHLSNRAGMGLHSPGVGITACWSAWRPGECWREAHRPPSAPSTSRHE